MLRTLTLSGLLQFVQHGTTAQCFVVSVISFASFGLQQWLRPYREHESNVLKALVDKQLLFLTFLIASSCGCCLRLTALSRSTKSFTDTSLCTMIAIVLRCRI